MHYTLQLHNEEYLNNVVNLLLMFIKTMFSSNYRLTSLTLCLVSVITGLNEPRLACSLTSVRLVAHKFVFALASSYLILLNSTGLEMKFIVNAPYILFIYKVITVFLCSSTYTTLVILQFRRNNQ